ncbi:MAG: OmpA family protein [Bacteroidota bacterium]
MSLRSWLIGVVCCTAFASYGQISFYGASEKVDSLNSRVSEQYLSISRDGNTLYFSRENYPLNTGGIQDEADIWMSTYSDSIWSKPENLAAINDDKFTSPIGFTGGGQYFLYNKVRFEKGIYVGEIFVSDRSYENPRKLEIPAFRNYSPTQSACISQDGKYLVMSIETNIGYGVDDLYVSTLQDDGSWSRPRNLGYSINTAFQEITPFLAGDNKTLIFATNGREGKGSFDLYMTTRLDDTWRSWSTPVNLEAINTSGAETSLVFRAGKDYAYYISTQNSDGYGDIRRIRITEDIQEVEEDTVPEIVVERKPLPAVNFNVVNTKTGNHIDAQINLINQDGDTLKYNNTDSLFVLESEDRMPYRVEFRSQGFLKDFYVVESATYHTTGDTTITIGLEPLETGNIIVLKNVLFYRGTANFVEGSERELNLIVDMLQENPQVKILLKGHTDNRGDAALNMQLSEERAKAVADYLVDHDISRGRIESKGFGGNEPVASNFSEETRQLNRRVEFEVIEN